MTATLVSVRDKIKNKKNGLTSHHSDLIMNGCDGPYEPSKLRADRTTTPPLDERVKDDLVTTWQIKQIFTSTKPKKTKRERHIYKSDPP